MASLTPFDADPRLAIGSSPVSPEQPAGLDCRSSSEFDALDTEIRKLDTEGPNGVDWRFVADQGLEILAHRSKDLLVGAWVAFALHRREGIGGLTIGLTILLGMVRDHWEGASPPARRERARTAPFDWLVGRVAPAVAEASFAEADGPALIRLRETVNEIDDVMTARLTKESLNLGELLRAVRPHADAAQRLIEEASRRREEEQARLAAAAEAAAAEAANRSAAASAPSAAPAAPPALEPARASSGAGPGATLDIETLPEVLWALARDQHSRDIADPRSYTIGRIASWLRIEALPPAQGATTSLPVPPALEALESDESRTPEQMLKLAETLVWDSPFALDAHRLSHDLLGKIPGDHAAAQGAIAGELAAFLRRFPAVRSLTFSDGRPFASEDTQALAGAGDGGGAAAIDDMEEALGRANAMMREGRAYEAHALIAEALKAASSGRQRARWQVVQARFCLDHGYAAAALPLLDHLDRLVEARDLEQWEPDLACAVAELRLRALVQPGVGFQDEAYRAKVEAARARLARLDIAATIRLLAG